MSEFNLELRGLSKSFGKNQVLFDVNFQLRPGEIHAIIGENGAGKSTMMNITYGLVKANGGEIYVDGEKVTIREPNDAQKHGICFVHQEIALCQEMSVAQNIFMARIKDMHAINIDYNKINEEAQTLLDSIIPGIDATMPVEQLNIAGQQVVEIAKALSSDCRILILDEPTSSLSEKETVALYKIMHDLKAKGIGIIYISHRLAEIFEQCDRVSVLRDGYMINTYNVKDVSAERLVNDMAGREVHNIYPPKAEHVDRSDDNVVLDVQDFTDPNGKFRNINFKLYKGEVLGFSGLIGSGRTETMEGIVGLRKNKPSGKAMFNGVDVATQATRKTYSSGLVYLSEDRKTTGLFLDMGIHQNTSSMHPETITNGFLVNNTKELEQAKKYIKELRIRCSSPVQPVMSLSGGNQQKVMFSKLMTTTPKVVIADEPTRGVDVGAKSELHGLLRGMANDGAGVIIVSSELNEIIGMCDRVLVMYEGDIVAEINCDEINGNNIMNYASGAYLLEQKN